MIEPFKGKYTHRSSIYKERNRIHLDKALRHFAEAECSKKTGLERNTLQKIFVKDLQDAKCELSK